MPVGDYAVKVEAYRLKTRNQSGIVVNVNDDVKINIALEVGAMSETVEVTAQTGGVELATPANAAVINGTQIRELSLATRNYEQLVPLTPAVTPNSAYYSYLGVSAPAGPAAPLPL